MKFVVVILGMMMFVILFMVEELSVVGSWSNFFFYQDFEMLFWMQKIGGLIDDQFIV